LHPCDGPDPVLGLDIAEVGLLLVQVGGDVVAHEGEEAGNGKGLVAVAQDLKVDGLFVVEVAEERDDSVDGDHDEDADDVRLLVGLEVVCGVAQDEEEGDDDGDDAKCGGEDEAEVMEGEALP
jgi:hypothetical protein